MSKTWVFLDVDGVLNCSGTKELSPEGFTGVDDKKIKLLADFVHDGVLVTAEDDEVDEINDELTEDDGELVPGYQHTTDVGWCDFAYIHRTDG